MAIRAVACYGKEAMAHTIGGVLAWVLCSAAIVAQQQPNSTGPQPGGSPAVQAAGPETAISLVQLGKNVLHDQKPIWTFPARAVRGKHWKPVLAVALGAAGLVALDPYTEPYFHNPSRFGAYKTGPLRGRNTTLAETLTPVAFYVAGLAKHSPHSRNTGLLAAEGLAGAQIVCFVMKQAVGRLTPSDVPPDGNLRNTWFQYKGGFTNGGSFPSGHSASAFAVATVIAARYREHRWIPWAAYGTAAFLSLTRLPDQAHFPSDIFIGAAIGYSISHFVVLGR
jgi:membrane-associated phospholipid phosphatase